MNILEYAVAKKMFSKGGGGGGESGVPIEVAELPTPTAEDIGKVYKVGESYYVGEQSLYGSWEVGNPLSDKIYFDTSVNIADYGSVVTADGFLAISATSDTAQFMIMIGEVFGGGDMGHCYLVMCGDMSTGMPSVVYAQCDVLTVDQFNEMVAPELGLPSVSNFGWQTDVYDTSAFADCIIEVNNLSYCGNFAHGQTGVKFTFNNTNQIDDYVDGTLVNLSSNALSVIDSAFQGNSRLINVQLHKATSIGSMAFDGCAKLATVDCPNATSIGVRAFYECGVLTDANFPKLTTVPNSAFRFCFDLARVIVSNASSIQKLAFSNCSSLIKLVVGTNLTTVATLAPSYDEPFFNCNHFTEEKDGYIYVPHSLVAKYRSTANWSAYATQIMPYVATVEELANIDGTTYDKACVGEDYVEYTYNGTSWELYTRS